MNSRLKKTTVFVSYSTKDGEYLRKVCNYLEQHDFEPLFDAEQLELGQPWRPGLRQLIEHADTMLVLFTENSVHSPWVLYEFIWGLARGKKPIFLSKTGVNIPDPIREYQGIMLTGDHFDDEVTLNRMVAELHRSAQQRSDNWDPGSEWGDPGNRQHPIIDMSDLVEVLKSVVDSYINIAINNNSEPHLIHIQKRLQMLQKGISPELLRHVFEEKLVPLDLAESFTQVQYNRQIALGRLISQTIEDPLYHLQLSDPIQINQRFIFASRYLLTNGVYYAFEKEVYNKNVELGGSIGEPYVFQLDNISGEDNLIYRNFQQSLSELFEWIAKKLNERRIVGRVRLPTRQEWIELASHAVGWKRPILKACNIVIDGRDTQLSVVGTFPESRSQYNCYDVIGNTWEVCQDDGKLHVAGWSFKNSPIAHGKPWNHMMELHGKGKGEPVGIRFIVETFGKGVI